MPAETRTLQDATSPQPRARLRRHVAIAVAAKLALLLLLYLMFFSPAQRPSIDAGAAADRLLAPG